MGSDSGLDDTEQNGQSTTVKADVSDSVSTNKTSPDAREPADDDQGGGESSEQTVAASERNDADQGTKCSAAQENHMEGHLGQGEGHNESPPLSPFLDPEDDLTVHKIVNW